VDALISTGRAETDPIRRAAIYHQYAIALADDLPVIYAWSDLAHEGIRKTIGTTDAAGLDLTSRMWFREIENLTNVR